MPEERNVRPCEELALPQPTKFGFRSQEDEQTSCTTSRLTLVLSMRERARLGLMRFIRLRVKICQLLRNTTFRGHNSTIRSRPDPLRAFTGSGCGYARLLAGMVNSSTIVPSDVLVCETTRSLRILGGRLCSDIPFTLQPVRPPSVSHVNTAVWSRKTTVLSGAWSISDSIIQKRHIPTFHRALVYLE